MKPVRTSLHIQVFCSFLLSGLCYCLPENAFSTTVVPDQDAVVVSSHTVTAVATVVPERYQYPVNADAIVPERYQYPMDQGPESLDKTRSPESLTGGSGHFTAGSASAAALLIQDNHPLVTGRGKHLPANQIVDIVLQLVFMLNAADVNDNQGSQTTLVPQDVDMSGDGQNLVATSRVQHLITTDQEESKSWLSMHAPGFSKAEINDEFYLFDWDDDKHITPGELGKVMQELGLDPTAKTVYNIIRHFDQDHSGSVTRGQEFYKMMLTRHSQHDEALDSDNMQTFNLLDADGDSKISGDEMRAVYAKLERRSNDLPLSELSDDAINDMLQKCPSKLWLPLKFMDYNRLSMQFFVHVFNPKRIQKLDKGQLDYDAENDKTQ